MKKSFPLLTIALILSGCAHHVKYKLAEGERWNGPRINAVVCVKPFADTTSITTNRVEKINKETWRLNYRGGYANTNLGAEVTAMVAKHLDHSGLFAKVVTDPGADADLVLSGTLTEFKTRARVNDNAETIQAASAGFGLIGALVGGASTAHMTSEVQSRVGINPVSLSDLSGRIIWQDAVALTNEATVSFAEAEKSAVFRHTDNTLKQAISELIRRMANSPATNHHKAPTL